MSDESSRLPEHTEVSVQNISAEPLAAAASDEPDAESRQEEDFLEKKKLELEIASLKQDIEARKEYAKKIFWLILAWLMAVLVILFFEGFKLRGFHLDDSVLIAIVSSTTITGIFAIVANYLFPKR
ncbi:MAG TPA: hypothetical protein VLV89_08780 [Candidatus Acidoferrum sp.]|nr:hypothetical protein [Candidatus Acidoferrum sp.]